MNGLRHFSHENHVKQTWHFYSRLINGHICLWWLSLPASSPIWASVLARLVSLAQIGELARSLVVAGIA